MRILKVSSANPGNGTFAAVMAAPELPNPFNEFALCQICRVTDNGNVIKDPAQFLNWTEPQDNIKINTRQPDGWFMDHLQYPENENFIYYSQPPIDQVGILNLLNNQNHHALLYGVGNVENVTEEMYAQDYAGNFVSISNNLNTFPILYDSPGQNPGVQLDFQVHVLYRVDNNIGISGGFSWNYLNGQSTFVNNLVNPSPEFIACLDNGINYQNAIIHTHWVRV